MGYNNHLMSAGFFPLGGNPRVIKILLVPEATKIEDGEF